MKINLLILVSFLISTVSCSQLEIRKWNPHKDELSQQIHRDIIDNLKNSSHSLRGPAGDNFLNESFDRLKYMSPGKFEIYVFPKFSSMTSKENGDEDYLGPPKLFEVSLLAVNTCDQFINFGLFKKFRPQDIFPASLGENKKRHCAILEIENKSLTSMNKSLLKQDDQLVVRIFIDDNYQTYGVDQINYQSRGDFKIIRRIAENESLTAGLSFFPMDLPIERSIQENVSPPENFDHLLDGVAIFQIRNKYSKNFQSTRCNGKVYRHKDPFGGIVQIGWCQGFAWPTYLENSRYFSVTSSFKVGR